MSIIKEYVTEKSIRKKNRQDLIVRNIFRGAAILSASFIIIIIAFTLYKGISPFISDNNGLGNVNIFKFIFGMEWLKGAVNESVLYGIGFAAINTLVVGVCVRARLIFSVPSSTPSCIIFSFSPLRHYLRDFFLFSLLQSFITTFSSSVQQH